MKDYIEKVKAMLSCAGIHYGKLAEVFEDSERTKAELNKTLGLSAANSFRKELELVLSEEEFHQMYPIVQAIFKGIPGWTGKFSPTSGKITVGKDNVNVTKFLAKQLADGKVTQDYKHALYDLLKIDRANPKAEAQIVPKFGEIISAKTKNVVIVSTNPFDFFTSSAGDYKYASFKSCFRPGGEYFNGCISLARDDFSTISYKAATDRIDYKQGRAWLFVLEDIIAQTKSYGTFTNNERKIAREYVEHCLAAKYNFDPKTYKRHLVEKWKGATNKDVLYFDDYNIDLGYPAAKFSTFSDRNVPKLRFSDSKCLKCGRETQHPAKGICGVCNGSTYACGCCDIEIRGGDYHQVENKYYCGTCVTEKFELCGICGKYHVKGSAIDTTKGAACPDCIRRSFYLCGHCGLYHYKDVLKHNMIDIAELWCDTCFKKDGFRCPDCGGAHSLKVKTNIVLHDGSLRDVCNVCVAAYAKCIACDSYFKDGYTTGSGDVCSICYDKYDYCVHCDSLHTKEDMVFDGTKICCRKCATDAPESNGSYLAAMNKIIVTVNDFKEATKDTLAEALLKLREDRIQNGYKVGDIVKVTGDTSWHEYPVGSYQTVCKAVVNKNGDFAYLTFRNNAEWYIMAADIEFARPAVTVGEEITLQNKKTLVTVKGITTNKEEQIMLDTTGGLIPVGSPIEYNGVVNAEMLAGIERPYRVGELLLITGNMSNHPFATGDKVKVIRVDRNFGMNRAFVKKGTKLGCIYGVDVDTTKAPKAEPSSKAGASKAAAAKKVATFKDMTYKYTSVMTNNDF